MINHFFGWRHLPRKTVGFLKLTILFLMQLAWIAPAHAWQVQTSFGLIEGGAGQYALTTLLSRILNILYGLAGISALVMIVFGAYRYISAAGDAKAAQEAKEIIQSAISGLVLILIAYALAQLMGNFWGDDTLYTNPQI